MLLGDIGPTARPRSAQRRSAGAELVRFSPDQMHARQSGADRGSDLGALSRKCTRSLAPVSGEEVRPSSMSRTSSTASARNCIAARDRVEIFSRDLRRITDQFPDLAERAREFDGEVILDGEIMAFEDGRQTDLFRSAKTSRPQKTKDPICSPRPRPMCRSSSSPSIFFG